VRVEPTKRTIENLAAESEHEPDLQILRHLLHLAVTPPRRASSTILTLDERQVRFIDSVNLEKRPDIKTRSNQIINKSRIRTAQGRQNS
jgi:hypothetical protein